MVNGSWMVKDTWKVPVMSTFGFRWAIKTDDGLTVASAGRTALTDSVSCLLLNIYTIIRGSA